ncbi:MAG: hypothetical protein ACI4P4_15505 [Faecousia sp.]
MTQLEKDVEQALVRMVKRHGGLCLKWVCPGHSGVPDRIILLPGGRVVFVETKRPDCGRRGKLQIWWADKLMSLGLPHRWVTCKADVDALEFSILSNRWQGRGVGYSANILIADETKAGESNEAD